MKDSVISRKITRQIHVGDIPVGGGAPIPVQSMTNTDTHDAEATLRQIRALEEAGCDIVRLAVPDVAAADTFRYLKTHGVHIPLVADIHFNYEIALAAVAAGADKIRINPGNIGERAHTEAVVRACRERGIPIRIGVNTGSLEPRLLEKYGRPTAEALAESAMGHIRILEELVFVDIAVSVKASDVSMMIVANRILSRMTDYPLHLGVTEAGARYAAAVKSAVGIGTLLAEGIGDTVRVSLTEDPVHEIAAARQILRTLGLDSRPGMDIVSCPTCGRTKINLIRMAETFERRAAEEHLTDKPLKVALMGCVVNGPGEAREADIGIAGGKGEGLLFKKGKIVRKIPESELIDALIEEIRHM